MVITEILKQIKIMCDKSKGMKFMWKKIFGLIISAVLISGCFSSNAVFAAAEVELAAFSYTAPASAKAGADIGFGNGTDGYSATGGVMQSESKLYASVSGSGYTSIVWSSLNDYNKKSLTVPIMCPDTDGTAWGYNPYFEIKTSTKGYTGITLSAKVSGSKKGPGSYKLQYKTDGGTYADVAGSNVTIKTNKDMTANLFDGVTFGGGADNADTVYFRIIAASDTAIDGTTKFSGATGGEASINNVVISGTPTGSEKPTLASPAASISGGEIYANEKISLSCSTLDSAVIMYSINNGQPVQYTGKFMPFKNISDKTVTVSAWAEADGYNKSETAVYTYTSTKDEITSFDFSDKKNYDSVNGEVKAASGVYQFGRITASLDKETKYAPLYDEAEKAISISPDDTYLWHKGGYWQAETSSAGYDKVYISADAYSSNRGPAYMTLCFSTDGVNFKTVYADRALPTESMGAYFNEYELPSEAANAQKLYIRFVTDRNERVNGDTLFENESKGNTYIGSLTVSGDRSDSLKMPCTTKSTSYFGPNGTISYKSYDDAAIKYSIYTSKGTPVAENMTYSSADKIALAKLKEFDPQLCNKFRVDVWAEDGNKKSAVNSQVFTYKGDRIAAFEYDDTNSSDLSSSEGGVKATYGDAALIMRPNGITDAAITYKSSAKALRASADADNVWTFDKTRTNADGDGYWLVKASTEGYRNITFSADMSSTNKGPRDYSISVGTDGINYTPLANSGIRVTDDLNSVYTNIPLPDELADKKTVFIKIKIDGGETLSGIELDSPKASDDVIGKGNTDINNIEICGTKIEDKTGIDGNPEKIEKGKTYYINRSSSKENSVLILAGYGNDGELTMYDLDAEKFEIPSDSNITDIKIMLWEDLKNPIPLVTALNKEIK